MLQVCKLEPSIYIVSSSHLYPLTSYKQCLSLHEYVKRQAYMNQPPDKSNHHKLYTIAFCVFLSSRTHKPQTPLPNLTSGYQFRDTATPTQNPHFSNIYERRFVIVIYGSGQSVSARMRLVRGGSDDS